MVLRTPPTSLARISFVEIYTMTKATYQPWTGSMVWDAESVGKQDEWIVQLSASDIDELCSAVQSSMAAAKPIGSLTQADFPFKQFARRLRALQSQLLEGRGFALLQGLPAAQWSDEELVRAYWGIGTWMGDAVSQNAKAHLLGHVIDQRTITGEATRIYQTSKAQPFHSDSCDIVGLLCLRTARQGGESSVASSAAIHNALLASDPDALETLYGEFLCDRYGEIPEGKKPYYAVRVFNNVDEKPVCCGMDPDIRSAQRLDAVPSLTPAQVYALDLFQKTARELALTMSLQRGDIQLVNNLVVVHAREEFEDHSELDKRRHLVRLWLSAKRGRRLPEFLKERWGTIEVGGLRGGIAVPGASPVACLSPDN